MTKLALLIGINYQDQKDVRLQGCANDIRNVYKVLRDKFGFDRESIIVLTDDNSPKDEFSAINPTCVAIHSNLSLIVNKAHALNAKELWIHYSGHGSQVRDYNNDEDDQKDEVILPVDYKTRGVITDDELNKHFSFLPVNTNVFCMFDCCHSGTMLDLSRNYIFNTKTKSIEQKSQKKQIHGNVTMISGCLDTQTSSESTQGTGAMTDSFLKVLKNYKYSISYFDLLREITNNLVEKGYNQRPRLSSNTDTCNLSIFCAGRTVEPSFRINV